VARTPRQAPAPGAISGRRFARTAPASPEIPADPGDLTGRYGRGPTSTVWGAVTVPEAVRLWHEPSKGDPTK
jgi:hypothetical protein